MGKPDQESAAAEEARRATGDAAGRGRGGRLSARRKRETVLRLLRGEDLESVSRELGITAARAAQWRDQFLAAGQASLKSRAAVGKSRLNPARFVVRDAYGALFKPVVSDEEVDAAEDDEEESDADADDGGQGRTRRPVELVADLPLLAVRMVLYDPRKQDGIEPQIEFGVMSDWRVGSDEEDDPGVVEGRW